MKLVIVFCLKNLLLLSYMSKNIYFCGCVLILSNFGKLLLYVKSISISIDISSIPNFAVLHNTDIC